MDIGMITLIHHFRVGKITIKPGIYIYICIYNHHISPYTIKPTRIIPVNPNNVGKTIINHPQFHHK